MSKISVVILNFNRPEYIQNNILPIITNIDIIDEILISHGKKETAFEDSHYKVKSLNHWGEYNEKYGLARRFLTAKEAKNEYIIIMDDDIIPSDDTVKTLYNKIKTDPERIYGLYGRGVNKNNLYQFTNLFGKVAIVLTRFLITHKNMVHHFLDNYQEIEKNNPMIKNSKPYWNGEDITFSLLSITKYGKLPEALDLQHTNRIANYLNMSEGISTGNNEHLNYRQELTAKLIEQLDLSENIKNNSNIKKKKSQFSYFFFNSNLFILFIILLILVLFFSYTRKYFV